MVARMIADDLANAVLELERAWMAKVSERELGEHIGHCARLARRANAEPETSHYSLVHLWAPVSANPRSTWIDYTAIRSTRRESKRALLDGYDEASHKGFLKGVTFERIEIRVARKAVKGTTP